jgi:hypothetical protein
MLTFQQVQRKTSGLAMTMRILSSRKPTGQMMSGKSPKVVCTPDTNTVRSLGGVMIWAVDLDDDKSSALSGLIGKDLPTFAEDEAALEAASGNWASQNGQNCKMTDCLADSDVGTWGAQWAIAPNGGAFKDSCGKNKNKYVGEHPMTDVLSTN